MRQFRPSASRHSSARQNGSPWRSAKVLPLRQRRRGGRRLRDMMLPLAVFGIVAMAAIVNDRFDIATPAAGVIDNFATRALPGTVGEALPPRHLPVCAGPVRRNCVVDGDTLWLDGEKIRIANINAPEVKGECPAESRMAGRATERLRQLVGFAPLDIARDGRDKYGRTLAYVSANGRDVGEVLIAQGLAERWDGERIAWCGF